MRIISNAWMLLWAAGLGGIGGVTLPRAGAAPTSTGTLTNVAQCYLAVRDGCHGNYTVELEGIACWVATDTRSFVLQDASGAIAVAGLPQSASIRVGERLHLAGVCSAQRNGLSFELTQALAVDNDGLHPATERAGSVHLPAGWNPVRLAWFNSRGEGVLKVAYEGPGTPRQPVPATRLARILPRTAEPIGDAEAGLNYQAWEGEWAFVPNFGELLPAATGVAANFDVRVRPRPESVGLEFSGWLNVPQPGRYTFYIESDDGALLYVGAPSLQVARLGLGAVPKAPSLALGKTMSQEEEYHRYEVEGEVTFVEERHRALRLELRAGEDHLTVDVANARGAPTRLLRGSRVRATGICQSGLTLDGRRVAGLLWVPSWPEVRVLALAPERWALQPAVPITNLAVLAHSASASNSLARVRGHVTALQPDGAVVVADASGQVTVRTGQLPPEPGSSVEVMGTLNSEGGQPVLMNSWVQSAFAEAGDGGGNLPLLTTIAQVRGLSPEAASRTYPARVQGVVTAVFENALNFVIQDAAQGIFISVAIDKTRPRLEIGDTCEITGTTRSASWAPLIDALEVTRTGLGRLPEPLRPSRDQILNGSLDSQYVELQGLVTRVQPTGIRLLTRMGPIDLEGLGAKSLEEWQRFEDALVRIRGCVLAVYDPVTRVVVSGRVRFIHPTVMVDEYPPADPFAVPLKPVAALRAFDPQAGFFQHVKVAGQIVYAHNGLYCLMEGTNGLRFHPKRGEPPPRGTRVELVGILDLAGPSPILHEALVRERHRQALPEAALLTGTNLLSGARDATLVRTESLLLNARRDGADQVLELRTGPHLHTARLHTNFGLLGPIPAGSRLALTGVYVGKGGDWAAGQEIEDFDLALQSPVDVTVLERPSWWTPRRLLGLAGSLATVLLLALAWITVLRRQVEERTRQLAQQIQARQRVEQQRAIEQERTRLARDLHDDLGGGLTEISMLGFLANDRAVAAERKSGYLQQMTEKARELVASLDEIVWAVNPRYDSIASLAGYCSLYAQRFLGLTSIACHLEVADTLPDLPLDSKVRHGMFLAFKEALNNVVRHAAATEVRLRILVEDDELIVTVIDNGRGLQTAADSAPGADGLANMRARLAGLGGRCDIQSAPAQGTTVLLGVRLAGGTR